MTRGVYWPLATWIATRSEPNVKTTKERLSVMTVLQRALAPSIPRSNQAQPVCASITWTMARKIRSAIPAKTGMIQSDERR